MKLYNFNTWNFYTLRRWVFTFSSEKVLDSCKIGPPRFYQMSTFWDPLNPKKWFSRMCLSVCQEMKVKFVSQPFLTNGSGFIHQKRFFTKSKNPFFGQTMRDTKKCYRLKLFISKKSTNFVWTIFYKNARFLF